MKKIFPILLVCALLVGLVPVVASAESVQEASAVSYETAKEMIAARTPDNLEGAADIAKEWVVKNPNIKAAGDYIYYENESNDSPDLADMLYSDYTIVGEIGGYDMDFFAFTVYSQSEIMFVSVSDRQGPIMCICDESGEEILAVAEELGQEDGLYTDVIYGTIPAGTYLMLMLDIDMSYTTEYMFYYEAVPVSSHNHSYIETVVEPTCEDDGYTLYTCSQCGDSYKDSFVAFLGHDNTVTTVEPTCENEGYTEVYCNRCGNYYTHMHRDPLGHSFADGVCDICGAVDPDADLKFDISFANMTLGNSLAMNFAFEKGHRTDWTGCYATIVKEYADGRADKEVTIPYAQWGSAGISGVAHYTLKFDGVAAKEMSDSVYVTIYDANREAISNVWEDSVRGYAMRTLNNPNTSQESAIMVVDLLNYGAAAQEYFGYNTSDLANNQMTAEQKALATKSAPATDSRVKGENYKGTNLGLESQILMRMAFGGTTTDMYAVISFTSHTGKENNIRVEGSEFGSTGVIVIDEIVIADGRQPVTVTVYNADGSVYGSATDSMESYIARMGEADALYEMILKFSDSAYNFFH